MRSREREHYHPHQEDRYGRLKKEPVLLHGLKCPTLTPQENNMNAGADQEGLSCKPFLHIPKCSILTPEEINMNVEADHHGLSCKHSLTGRGSSRESDEVPMDMAATVKVKEISIRGFKSFKSKSKIGPLSDFSCIVGPNGAGKSVCIYIYSSFLIICPTRKCSVFG